MGAWADRQRKMSKWGLIVAAVIFPAMIIFSIVTIHQTETKLEHISVPENHDWCDVEGNIRRCDLATAIQIGEELIQKTPQYPKGHEHLATAYLAAGKLEEARTHFAEAARLFPCEEYEKNLVAIDKRLATANP